MTGDDIVQIADPADVDHLRQPWWRWEEPEAAIFAARMNGALVACVRLFARSIELPGVVIRAAGIGGLYTAPNHRGGGCFAYRLLEHVYGYARARFHVPVAVFYSRLPFYDFEYARGRGYVPLRAAGAHGKLWARSLVDWLQLRPNDQWKITPETHF